MAELSETQKCTSALECSNEEKAVVFHYPHTANCRSVLLSGLEYASLFCFLFSPHPFPIRFLRNDESSFIVAGVQSWASFE